MSKIYLLDAEMRAKSLQRLKVKDEDEELQTLLLKNPSLLPSEQIDPDNPPQWLLVKREMPVTDPSTGAERWSVDFLYVDHMAIPTLVECKRCNDTRSRREVIAQMLEYAANGHHYWTASDLQSLAQESAGGVEPLAEWISRHRGAAETAKDFFEAVCVNLRESRMRLIFFLEESPNELRSLVDFLNRQLKMTDVLLVEARQYNSTSGRVVVPWLFGYSEEARVAKRESRAQAARLRTDLGEEAFRAAIDQSSLSAEVKSAIQSLLEAWPSSSMEMPTWVYRVNAIFMVPSMLKTRGLFHVGRDGVLSPYFGYWNPENAADVGTEQVQFRDGFAEVLRNAVGVQFNDKQLRGFPNIKPDVWVPKAQELIVQLRQLIH